MSQAELMRRDDSSEDVAGEWSIWAALALLPFGPWWVFHLDHL